MSSQWHRRVRDSTLTYEYHQPTIDFTLPMVQMHMRKLDQLTQLHFRVHCLMAICSCSLKTLSAPGFNSRVRIDSHLSASMKDLPLQTRLIFSRACRLSCKPKVVDLYEQFLHGNSHRSPSDSA